MAGTVSVTVYDGDGTLIGTAQDVTGVLDPLDQSGRTWCRVSSGISVPDAEMYSFTYAVRGVFNDAHEGTDHFSRSDLEAKGWSTS